MPTTYSVDNFLDQQPLVRTTAAPIIDVLSFASGVTQPNAQGGEDTIYRFQAGGSPELPTTLRIGSYPPVKVGQSLNTSAKLRVAVLKTSGDGVETIHNLEVVIAINDPTLGMLARADVVKLVYLVASALATAESHTSPDIQADQLTALSVGVTDLLPLIPDPDNV